MSTLKVRIDRLEQSRGGPDDAPVELLGFQTTRRQIRNLLARINGTTLPVASCPCEDDEGVTERYPPCRLEDDEALPA